MAMTGNKVEILTAALNARRFMMASAESCTGGLISAAVTERAGSSSVFDRGFVSYSYESKEDLLGVSHEILENYGAVSHECASAMVQGALDHSRADIAVAVTGIAGPGGGLPGKPVGLVYIAVALRGQKPVVTKNLFTGDRNAVRGQTVDTALQLLIDTLGEEKA